jgi:DNA-binding CsgD family transcriptional regulator
MLIGRSAECAAVDQLLREVRGGGSGSLVVRGDPGIGKSALLGYAAESAQGFRVLQVTGIESEMEFAFAAVQQLCAPLIGHLGKLPGPQAEALRVAFGLADGAPPDRFLVGLGVLGLAAEDAVSQPLLCLADDAQWIDQTSLQALAFVARRLQRESVAIILAARVSAEVPDLTGLPERILGGLPDPDARALLTSVVPGRLDERVRDRIIAEAAGNPLAVLEFSQEVTETGDLAGGFGVSPWLPRPLADRVEERYLARTVALPAPARRLLLLAAAEPLGDPALLDRASRKLGMRMEDISPAELAGLIRVESRVTFRHPLVRSAIYRSAPASDRQVMHGVLADVTDAASDPDHVAWHRAHATFGPDEAVAADLERSAGRALARGGPAAAAAFLERAAALSPDAVRRADRTLAAARGKYDAGSTRAAGVLLATAQAGPLGELQQAQADELAARIMTATSRTGDAPAMLVRAAARFARLAPGLGRRTYLDAIMAAMLAVAGEGDAGWQDVARAARAAPAARDPGHADDLLLDGLVVQATEGYAAGLDSLRRAIAAFLAESPRSGVSVGVLWLACRTAMNLWDDESWYQLASRLVVSARGAGTLIDMPGALAALASVTLLTGDFAAAASLFGEAYTTAAAIGTYPSMHGQLALAAWQGQQAPEPGRQDGTAADQGNAGAGGADHPAGSDIWTYTTAVRCNGLGRYAEALAAAQRGSENADKLGYALWALPELAEAAARCGRGDLAAAATSRLAMTANASKTEWGLGMEARSRAFASTGAVAEEAYQEAIARLGATRLAAHLARAHLVYGEWLRREKRRLDARAQLRTAHEMLTAMGAGAFARRAEHELAATGERVRKRDIRPVVELTPQEAQIARLASDGRSNPDIAAQLFISPRTVEYHLHKIFTKLDISSRGQLTRALASRQ